MMLTVPIALPLLAAAGYAALGWRRRTTAWLGALAAAGVLASGIGLAVRGTVTGLGGQLRADALSAFMLIVIGAVALLAMLASPAHLAGDDPADARAHRRYGVLTQGFVAAMALAVLAANLGVLWVAVEATTVLTAFLVGHRRTRSATEAAWKYVVICSVGIAVALLGVVLLNFAASHAGLGPHGLDLVALGRAATDLDPAVTCIAVGLLLLGFGTKAGLAPMHAWLPDAHAKAPAPVSALMSGVLLSVAFYAILRVKVVADAALGTGFARGLLLIGALASLTVAALLLIAQRDYKRMLAYSSIEHMGLIALGAAIGGPLALAAVLLHILGHGLVKAVLFVSSGHIQSLVRSNRIARVRGLAARAPVLGGVFGVGLLGLLGLPPFSLFASEVGIARAGFDAGLGWAVVAALAATVVVVASIGGHVGRMLLGPPRPVVDGGAAGMSTTVTATLLLGLTGSAVLGLTTGPLRTVLEQAAAIAGGGQ